MIGDRLGVPKYATTMAVYFVSKALCAMGGGLVLLPTSDVKGIFKIPFTSDVGNNTRPTMFLAHIKYRITHMLCPTLYAAITNELLF